MARKRKPHVKTKGKIAEKLRLVALKRIDVLPRAKPDTAGDANIRATKTFPIVGIGASAGGLEALELFLKNMPKDSGMAFVIVLHLDPTHKGMIVEILQRDTAMKVVQVEDRMRVHPNCVYVIPPNKDMSILHGVLHLLDPVAPRGLRLPIDLFFRSLADDRLEQCFGVILSGMGSDGTLGLRAIKEKAGVVFVQDPASAKFDGMPRSAIDAGLADVVAPVQEVPAKIIAYKQHAPLVSKSGPEEEDNTRSALEKIIILLRLQTGHDFSFYKKTTIYRRIERRMGIHQIKKIATYVRFLQENSQEVQLLFNELLIGVTSFFRDPGMWDYLKTKVLPALLADHPQEHTLRAWVCGCSSGEEAYSLAIVFKEVLEGLKPPRQFTLQIFATDLDRYAVEKARAALFPANISSDVSPERLRRFFVEREKGFEVAKSIREMVIFAPQNIIADPPFTKIDILLCRNLLIYMTPELQKKLIPLFHFALNPHGMLFLGSSETIGSFVNLFQPLEGRTRIYRRLDSRSRTGPIGIPTSKKSHPETEITETSEIRPIANIQTIANDLILQTYSPAAVFTSGDGDIIYINGKTGKYLEPASGKANWNIFAMAREGLRSELTRAFQKAFRKKSAVKVEDVQIHSYSGTQTVEFTVQPLREPEGLRGMVLIVFSEAHAGVEKKKSRTGSGTEPRKVQPRGLAREIEQAREEIQSMREEMQASQEELTSANEELQSTNEELQSTNEELTTSREEMQSLNEELQTVNQELQAKVDELSETNNDMKNLLDSTNIATLFLDTHLHVRRFTKRTKEITQIIEGDVGRPITDISSVLFYPELAKDAKEVLRTLVGCEKQVSTGEGNWYSTRILPYRTVDDVIAGVVITYSDITISKKLESENMRVKEALESRLASQASELVKAKEDIQADTGIRSIKRDP